MKNYARMSSRGFQSPRNIRRNFILAAHYRQIEGVGVEEVNRTLVKDLRLDGKKKGKHPPAASTVRGWVRDFPDLPDKPHPPEADVRDGILPWLQPYLGIDEFHARQDHRLDVMSQSV